MRMSYTPEEVYQLFSALGIAGRQAYRTLHLVPDILFPISYALLFAFTVAWFLVRLLPLEHPLQWLILIPLISGLADILENLSLVVSGLVYPNRMDWLAQVASLLTKIKFGLMPIGLVFLIIIVVMWFVRKRPASNVPKDN
jgi:ABC-type enterochelin transport system permease subunit